MSTYLTPADRGFLLWELAESLSATDHSPADIRTIIGDLNEQPNRVFYHTCVDWMPDCMDALSYNNQRKLERK